MSKLKNIIIYAVFPLLIIALAVSNLHIVLIPVIIAYFTTFFFLQRENIYKIMSGYNNKRGRTDKALRHVYRAYKLKNSSVHTALVFIYMLLRAGKYDKAEEIIGETSKKELTDFERHSLLTNKALLLWKRNRIADSLELFEKLIKDGESSVLYGSYGYVLTLGDSLSKALEVNEAAYGYNPNDKAIMDNLGLTYIKVGDLDKAHGIYKKLLDASPNFPEAYYHMAELMRLMNDYDSAVSYMKTCMSKPFNGLSAITPRDAERKLDQLKRLQGSVQ